ncbi:MAG: hypothetical protein E7161_04300 [Firmicutes bacterium]|nr:hypothetical protein [Bacillota bacterium]
MDDKFRILKNMAREYNPEDKSLTKKAIELANDYSKVCKSNFKLQQEIQQLKEENEKLKKIIKVYENPNDITGMFENCDELKDSDIK